MKNIHIVRLFAQLTAAVGLVVCVALTGCSESPTGSVTAAVGGSQQSGTPATIGIRGSGSAGGTTVSADALVDNKGDVVTTAKVETQLTPNLNVKAEHNFNTSETKVSGTYRLGPNTTAAISYTSTNNTWGPSLTIRF